MNYPGLFGSFLLLIAGLIGGWFTNVSTDRAREFGKSPIRSRTEGHQESQDPLPDRKQLVSQWTKPDLTLFITGSQHGYIEPCGCTGLENQKGGLMRRRDCQKILLDRGWNLVSLDLGDQLRRSGMQSILKLGATYETMTKLMKYDCIGLGSEELKMSVADIVQLIANSIEGTTPFVCSNVRVVDDNFVAPYRVIHSNGKKIGVIMVIADEVNLSNNSSEIKKIPAAQGIDAALKKIKQEGPCDLTVLLAQASKEVCVKYANQYPVDLVVVGDCPGEPTLLPEKVFVNDRTVQIIEVGTKGMHVGLVACNWKNGKLEMQYERVPLDARFQDDPEAKKIFVTYQKELEALYKSPANFTDIQKRKTPSGLTFVGSERCGDCHDEEYEIWKEGLDGEGGPHARATEDLVNPQNNPRAEIKRNFDPECLSCHVTGWDPQNYFPYETGYIDFEKDAHLHGNGCENCHGPGKEHSDAEEGKDQTLIAKYRKLVRRELKDAENMCLECHDIDNSPDFLKKGFQEYWKHIEH